MREGSRCWLDTFELSEATFLPPGSSDHSPCLIRIQHNPTRKNHIFKFCDMWIQNENFLRIVSEAWNIEVQSTPMFRVVSKLKNVKCKLKQLYRTEFKRISEKVKLKKAALDRVQNAADLHVNPVLQEEEAWLKQEYLALVNQELTLLQQKAKVHWLKIGETNSSFFHAKIKERRTAARITSIHNADGNLLTEAAEVESEFINFSTDLLGTNMQDRTPADMSVFQNGQLLSEEQKEILCKLVTNQEIKEAMLSSSPLKAPGPDGFSSGFYRSCWHIVGEDICCALRTFPGAVKC